MRPEVKIKLSEPTEKEKRDSLERLKNSFFQEKDGNKKEMLRRIIRRVEPKFKGS